MFRPRLAESPCAGELGPSVKRRIEKLFLKQRGKCLQVLSGDLVGYWLLFSAEGPHLKVYGRFVCCCAGCGRQGGSGQVSWQSAAFVQIITLAAVW